MKVEVVTSGIQGCSNCQKAKELVQNVLKDFPNIEFGEINSMEEPERIQALGMVMSGAIVIDGQLAFSNVPKEKKIREHLQQVQQRVNK
jgi:thiol-disulfide isomerase/thioredoxin